MTTEQMIAEMCDADLRIVTDHISLPVARMTPIGMLVLIGMREAQDE